MHVGWLAHDHSYETGIVDVRLIEKIQRMALKPVELYRGEHTCELCIGPSPILESGSNRGVINPDWARWASGRSSNGEIRVSSGQTIFAAPVLIIHYIEVHHYLPPDLFLKAVDEAPWP